MATPYGAAMGEFLKSTSVVASLPTLLYLGLAQRKNRLDLLRSFAGGSDARLENFLTVPYEFLPLAVSIAYGVAFMFVGTSTENSSIDRRVRVKRSLIVGALTGLFLSTVGRFGLNLPTKLFGMPADKAYTVHLVAIVLYMLIFLYVSLLMQIK